MYVGPLRNPNEGRRQVSPDGGYWPLWGPDSRELFYQTSQGPGSVTVMMAPIETDPTLIVDNSVPLFDGPYRQIEEQRSRPYDIAPNGQRFLMLKEIIDTDNIRDEAAIIVVQNWIEELKNLFPTSQ